MGATSDFYSIDCPAIEDAQGLQAWHPSQPFQTAEPSATPDPKELQCGMAGKSAEVGKLRLAVQAEPSQQGESP
jgi:hypothetical protein